LRRLDKLKAIESLRFKYISPYPVAGTLVFILSLALYSTCKRRPFISSRCSSADAAPDLNFPQTAAQEPLLCMVPVLVLFLLLPVTRILGLPLICSAG